MATRTERGTFLKGVSGNPLGRPRSESVALRLKLAEQGEGIANVVIQAALDGDIQAAKIVLDRVCPTLRPGTAPVSLALPLNPSLSDISRAILEHVADGRIGADVASQLVQAVGSLARVVEIDELERRLTALEG